MRKAAGVMLMPGVGFDVVPSDCLAAHVAARLPDATRLRLSVGGLTRASRGTAKTMVEAIAQGTRMRSNGRIVRASGSPTGTDGLRLRTCVRHVGVSWGDVFDRVAFDGHPEHRSFLRGRPQHAGGRGGDAG